MDKYLKEESEKALEIISSTIDKCEKAILKFADGTSQHTLLKNRIKALYISKSLLTKENTSDKFTKEELTEALRPISSIISKCEKAQLKFTENSTQYNRFESLIKAMNKSKALITDEINKRG